MADEHFALLDGARAIAAVAVVGVHVSFATGATFTSPFGAQLARLDVGVAVFFVLSGFLLYRPFVAARLDGTEPPATGRFLKRRFVRIFPAYWLTLTVVLLVSGAAVTLKQGFLWYSLLHVWDRDHVIGPVGQSWTLCAEVAFYVFVPIWAAGQRRLGAGTGGADGIVRRELATLGALWAVGWAFRFWAAGQPEPLDGMYGSWLPGWFDHFAIGMALAVLHTARQRDHRPAPLGLDHRWAPAVCWLTAILAFWVVSEPLGIPIGFVPFGYGRTLALHALYCVVAVGALLPAVFGPIRTGRGLGAVLANPVLVPLGVVSYGVYLWHEFFLDRVRVWKGLTPDVFGPSPWPTMGAVLLMTIPVAAASWFALEKPLLRRAGR